MKILVKTHSKVSHEETDIDRGSLVLVGYRKQNDSLFSDLNSREDLKTSRIKSFKILVTPNAPGAVVHAVFAGHLYANTFDQEDNCSEDNFKLEYPVIQ